MKNGDVVLIKSGPLSGYYGILDVEKNESLFDFFGPFRIWFGNRFSFTFMLSEFDNITDQLALLKKKKTSC